MKSIFLFLILVFCIGNIYSQKSNDNTIDIQEYTIVLDFSNMENSMIKGHTNIRIKPIQDNTSIINLDLLKLEIDSISCSLSDLTYEYNDTVISINLTESFNSSDEFDIKVYYHGSPVTDPIGFGGFYFVNGYAFNMGVAIGEIPHNYGKTWFPCNDNFIDRASYHFYITTKMQHTAVCNGELLSVTTDDENQLKTYEWKLNETIPTYLASIAVGQYSCYESIYNGILGEIPISIYTSGTTSNAQQSLLNLNSALSIFESKFGPYKWNRVGYVTVPFSGGAMEHATNIAISTIHLNGTQNYQDILYHELAHHWFGDLITCSSAEDMWINEGWATYCETIFREFKYGRENALDYQRTSHLKVLKDYNVTDGGFLALYPMNQNNTYSRTIYQKGGSVAHSLRGYLGDDLFFDAMKQFLNQYSFSDVSSYQFRDFLTDYTNIDMTNFFDTWVFSGGFVHYSIDSIQKTQVGENYDISVYAKQKLRGRTEFANSNRVEITFIKDDFSSITKLMEFDGENGIQTFSIPFEPMLVLCDYNEVLSDATTDITKIFERNEYTYLTNTYFKVNVVSVDENNPALLRITHNFVAPDTLKNNVPGLFIANHRYWTVEGNFPQTFKAKGEFYYNNINSANLDNNFITNNLDSLVLLYRPDRATDWSIESANHSKSYKRFTVDSLKSGEYSLAIYDWNQYVGVKLSNKIEGVEIYPNPNNGSFFIKFGYDFNGIIELFNISGEKVYSRNFYDNNNIEIITDNLANGTYIIEIKDSKNNKKESKKIIIQN